MLSKCGVGHTFQAFTFGSVQGKLKVPAMFACHGRTGKRCAPHS